MVYVLTLALVEICVGMGVVKIVLKDTNKDHYNSINVDNFTLADITEKDERWVVVHEALNYNNIILVTDIRTVGFT